MNSTTNKNTILHRSSRDKQARVIPSRGQDGFRKISGCSHPHSQISILSTPTPFRHPYLPVLSFQLPFLEQHGNTPPVPLVSLASTDAPLSPLVIPRTINIRAFNVRTLAQIGQKASLAITLSSLNVDICCVSETRIQDSSAVLQLSCPNSDEYFLRLSGDNAAAAAGRAGVGFALSSRAHKALIEWISVNSRMCTDRFSSSVKVGCNRS